MVGRSTPRLSPARRSATTSIFILKPPVGHSVPAVDLISKDRAETQKPPAGAPSFVRGGEHSGGTAVPACGGYRVGPASRRSPPPARAGTVLRPTHSERTRQSGTTGPLLRQKQEPPPALLWSSNEAGRSRRAKRSLARGLPELAWWCSGRGRKSGGVQRRAEPRLVIGHVRDEVAEGAGVKVHWDGLAIRFSGRWKSGRGG